MVARVALQDAPGPLETEVRVTRVSRVSLLLAEGKQETIRNDDSSKLEYIHVESVYARRHVTVIALTE